MFWKTIVEAYLYTGILYVLYAQFYLRHPGEKSTKVYNDKPSLQRFIRNMTPRSITWFPAMVIAVIFFPLIIIHIGYLRIKEVKNRVE